VDCGILDTLPIKSFVNEKRRIFRRDGGVLEMAGHA
jgi:hypothetical protein